MNLKAQSYKKRRKTIRMAEKYTMVKRSNLHVLISLQTLFSLLGLSRFIDMSGKRVWPAEDNTE